MHIKLLTLLTTLVSLTTALPQTNSAADLETETPYDLSTRNAAGVYGCDQPFWKGGCWWQLASGGRCHAWNSGLDSSFGPDYGISCKLYADIACSIPIPTSEVREPGLPWVRAIGTGAKFTPHSYKCHWLS